MLEDTIILRLNCTDFHFEFETLEGTRSSKIIGIEESSNNTISYACTDGNKIYGALSIKKSLSGKTVRSSGTVVRPAFRKHGIAVDLWTKMIITERPKIIEVGVISDRGFSLVSSLMESFPNIKWSIKKNGDRTLRRLQHR